jgi:hypothetical protein
MLALQRTAGNAAIVVQREYGAWSNIDEAFGRLALEQANTYLLYDADFAPVVPGRVKVWKTFTSGREVDEDHFFTDSGGSEQHVKVRISLYSGGDTFRGRVVSWNPAGQEINVARFDGWIKDNGDGTCSVHVGSKPRPADPGPPPHGGAPQYYDWQEVPV